MAIIAPQTAPNFGTGNYHRIIRAEFLCSPPRPDNPNPPEDRLVVYVAFYASAYARDTNPDAPLYVNTLTFLFSEIPVDPRTWMYDLLMQSSLFKDTNAQQDQNSSDNNILGTLDETKAHKYVEINNSRMEANLSTFPYQDKLIACDDLSRSDIDGTNGYVALMGAFPPDWVGVWKAADNSYVPVATLDDWKAFYSAMVAQGQLNFAHAQALKQKVSDAATIADVLAINWGTSTS